MNSEKFTNQLIHETSPYLLQHAHNPVDWHPWTNETLEKAEKENKLILISIGYSACHWCHVMEHESFEHEEVAKIMNENYLCIKVDREERPDVDQVYMTAVQIMTGTGGWPLNIVALPDGRPVWGGTYFKKGHWMDALGQISALYKNDPEQLIEYARQLEEGIQSANIIPAPSEDQIFEKKYLENILEKWQNTFDEEHGGYKRAPKFMMPTNYEFLLRYAYQDKDEKLLEFCFHTLNKISWGGVYDPVAGGFSRYSVDVKWHVPHFEKMLYDNAQLVQLYSKAYKINKNAWYKSVVYGTLKFIQNELSDGSGAFYTALDADSLNAKGEKEEGAFYAWTESELKDILSSDFNLFAKLYNINSFGRWEHDNFVLIRNMSFEEFAKNEQIELSQLLKQNAKWLHLLKTAREKRDRPGIDDKSLTSWNAMMLNGFCEAFKAFQEKEFLVIAEKNADFILKNLLQENGRLFHTHKNGQSKINAYLEDYAFVIEAFITLFEITTDEKYLDFAVKMLEIVHEDFPAKDSEFFNFNSSQDRALITKPVETEDNVIPASNSVMAKNLFKLGKILNNQVYVDKAEAMLKAVFPKIAHYPQAYSNWLDLMLNFIYPFKEVAILGANAKKKNSFFQQKYIPQAVVVASEERSKIGILKDRFSDDKDLIYICEHGKCQLPLSSEEEAMELLKKV
ncbi:thioredoxin domain-containing protein [Gramella sp. AN32]|uniref:Thioredoxin domain-containing protein n=1 Tax=Christiangramia antarctica TaxID=2058158 RepID=A0ABW5X8D8_9FLAO|nr:thioredoxin domain-containing protein [Gramella sp. AN32]MCM4155300.1 thioredoxin domain-containing protein [Gramella sp. AN32]